MTIMAFYQSKREKQLWILSGFIVLAIYSTLFVGRPLMRFLLDQNIQSLIFLSGMVLVGTAMVLHGLRPASGKSEMALLLGFLAVYVLAFLRFGHPERSHLMEYSVLTICIHAALLERKKHLPRLKHIWLITWSLAMVISLIDEFLQLALPERIFDYYDIVFNTMAVSFAIIVSESLVWIRRRIRKQKDHA